MLDVPLVPTACAGVQKDEAKKAKQKQVYLQNLLNYKISYSCKLILSKLGIKTDMTLLNSPSLNGNIMDNTATQYSSNTENIRSSHI